MDFDFILAQAPAFFNGCLAYDKTKLFWNYFFFDNRFVLYFNELF